MSHSHSRADSEAPLRDDDEFAPGAAEWPEEVSRRRFLQIMAASFALAGGACTRLPHGEILPYIRQPEMLVPGKPLYFATAMDFGGVGHGLLVRSNEGRPTKIEGNPDHPTSLGRSSVHAQASLLTLYDPARSQAAMKLGHPETWEGFLGELLPQIEKWKERAGAGVHLLSPQIASPTLLVQVHQFLTKFPKAQWHFHDAAFPRSPMPMLANLDGAEVVLSLDADLFGYGGANVQNALAFAKSRRHEDRPGRLYAVESAPSLTGAMADHRRALSPSALEEFAQQLASVLQDGAKPSDEWSAALIRDLLKRKGRCAVLAGEFQPLSVHAAARQMNEALGNVGQTIHYLAAESSPQSALTDLVASMQRGEVAALLMLGGNPAYDSPSDVPFAEALAKVPFSVHHGLYPNETAQVSRWHLPQSHFLETWSDVRASDGSESIAQPLIEPLYPSRSAHELLAVLLEQVPTTGYDIILGAWQQRHKTDHFESFWRKSLHDGVASVPAATMAEAPPSGPSAVSKPAPESKSLELIIRPDPHVLDGRLAENAWLQELPKPLTQLTWENAALLSPQTAQANRLKHGDVIELRYRGRALRTPIWVLPGHAEGCVTVHLGYGRTYAGPVGSGLGNNAFALQTSDAPWGGPGLEMQKVGEGHRFSTTQSERSMEGREPVRQVTADHPSLELSKDDQPESTETLYPAWKYERPAWGMVIDLSACIGCSACTMACQAENNIPVVGREQVLRRREMHWIRVDRYLDGDDNAPRLLHQPVPCMHCENAPCELVCPVGATVHDHEGLNVMVYNRCVGTRYCSNNCPYKVRRFNFLKFNDDQSETLKLMRNPNVSVRMRGVMEKCTYCLQRISAARIDAEKEKRHIRDGEVIPACAQACPADAIVFGDILDPASRVAAMKKSPRNYSLLGDLNTKPRTTYLARMRNPNPEIG